MAVKGWRGYGTARTARSDEEKRVGGGDVGGFTVVEVEVAWDSTTPARARFIPGKTRENRHLLRYLLSLTACPRLNEYIPVSIYRVYLYTRPSPPPSGIHRTARSYYIRR